MEGGYLASIGTLSFNELTESKVPVIVGIIVDDYDHFVVFRGTDLIYVYLADPIRGNIRTPVGEFLRQWQKNAILVVAKRNVDPKDSSALGVTAEEIYLGRTNRQEVSKQLGRATTTLLPIPPR